LIVSQYDDRRFGVLKLGAAVPLGPRLYGDPASPGPCGWFNHVHFYKAFTGRTTNNRVRAAGRSGSGCANPSRFLPAPAASQMIAH
jgi:hypothetical protein